MHAAPGNGQFPARLWLLTVTAILAIVAVGVIVNRVEGHPGSPIGLRLAAAAIVTVLVVVAKVVAGPRAAAATGVLGVLVTVVLLVQLG